MIQAAIKARAHLDMAQEALEEAGMDAATIAAERARLAAAMARCSDCAMRAIRRHPELVPVPAPDLIATDASRRYAYERSTRVLEAYMRFTVAAMLPRYGARLTYDAVLGTLIYLCGRLTAMLIEVDEASQER